ncbi:hypothetical protein ACWCSH_27960, partial [Streptosporangium sp. NPDC001682]
GHAAWGPVPARGQDSGPSPYASRAARTMLPAHGHAAAQMRPYRSGIKYGGDGFDLNELVVVTKHSDSHQGARYVMVTE